MAGKPLKDLTIVVRGAGEMASGVACRLHRANFRRILMLEIASPLAVRRRVSFCEAIHEGFMDVEGIRAVRVDSESTAISAWTKSLIAVRVDPGGESIARFHPEVLIDATLAKRNYGLAISDAPLVIALGPGFEAGQDCHVVVETNRGHDLGRLITSGTAAPNTGIPGDITGLTSERVLRSPTQGVFVTETNIGDKVCKGEVIGCVAGTEVATVIDGVVRGLIRPGTHVDKNVKIGDIDPRGDADYCDTVSEKARALGGAALEAILAHFNR
jgi:xanthine dehydrogenase accessory factor